MGECGGSEGVWGSEGEGRSVRGVRGRGGVRGRERGESEGEIVCGSEEKGRKETLQTCFVLKGRTPLSRSQCRSGSGSPDPLHGMRILLVPSTTRYCIGRES